MVGILYSFLLGWPILRGYVSFRECNVTFLVSIVLHPRKLTAGYPKWWALEKVTFLLNMAIFGIYVRFLGWKKDWLMIILPPWSRKLRVMAAAADLAQGSHMEQLGESISNLKAQELLSNEKRPPGCLWYIGDDCKGNLSPKWPKNSGELWKKPWLVGEKKGMMFLPSYMGIINKPWNKDPYEPSSISWK